MSTQVEVLEPKGSQVQRMDAGAAIVTPMMMLDRAVSNGAPIETIERLAALAERMESQRARREFDEAISAFKSEAPPIIKAREIKHGEKLISRYEDMSAISKAIDPILARHGLSYRFRTEALDKAVKVTCVISHRSGHSEETSLSGPHDTSGAKNAIQGLGSAVTYLQRYTLKAALGLSAAEDDDAGASSRPAITITAEEVEAIDAMIDAAKADRPAFLRFLKVAALEDLPAKQYDAAVSALRRKAQTNG